MFDEKKSQLLSGWVSCESCTQFLQKICIAVNLAYRKTRTAQMC